MHSMPLPPMKPCFNQPATFAPLEPLNDSNSPGGFPPALQAFSGSSLQYLHGHGAEQPAYHAILTQAV